MQFESEEVPQCAIYKLQDQESQWCRSVCVQRPENHELNVRGQEKMGSPPGTESKLSFLCIFVLFRLSMDLTMPAHKGEGTFFTHYPIPVLVSSRNTLIVAPGNGVSPAAWASLSSVKLTHKSNHHNHPTIYSGAVALWVLFCFYDFFVLFKVD